MEKMMKKSSQRILARVVIVWKSQKEVKKEPRTTKCMMTSLTVRRVSTVQAERGREEPPLFKSRRVSPSNKATRK